MRSQVQEIDRFLEELYLKFGLDFRGYSKPSLYRRVSRFLSENKISSDPAAWIEVFEKDGFLDRFLQQVTVNYSEMFRDPKFYSGITKDIIPYLATFPSVRIWVPGCAAGEEAYSFAIMLKEAGIYHKCTIYATDIDPHCLQMARKAIYPLDMLRTYSRNYLLAGGKEDFSTYYTANYGYAQFDKSLSERIIFASHNLVSESAFNSFQLISCRNVLIYFGRELQEMVLDNFNRNIEGSGYLCLGSRETIQFSGIKNQYKQISDQKIYKKIYL